MTAEKSIQRVTLKTDDFEELQEAATDWDQQYYQLSSGRFEGSLELTQVGTTQIFREHWGKKIRYKGTAPPGGYGFALPFDMQGTASWVGQKAERNSVILQAPGQEAHLVSSNNWDSLVFGISEEDVHSIVEKLSGQRCLNGGFHGVLKLGDEAASRVRRLGRTFLYQSSVAGPNDHIHLIKLSDQLVKTFLCELVAASEPERSLVGLTKPSRIVSRATELALSERSGDIELLDICQELQVSLRTLHYAFQDVAGLSPATWLRKIRLNRVHKALRRASPTETMVKQVAMDNGFLHAGHFSNQYQRLFGCLPSETLQRH